MAVRDGFLVASLDYDPQEDAVSTESSRGTADSEPSTESARSDDDSATNQVPFITVLSIGMTWVYYEIAVGVGPTLGMGIWWVVVGFFLLGAVGSDSAWVNATTDRELARWWPVVVPLVPPVAAPLYLLQHYRARTAAGLD